MPTDVDPADVRLRTRDAVFELTFSLLKRDADGRTAAHGVRTQRAAREPPRDVGSAEEPDVIPAAVDETPPRRRTTQGTSRGPGTAGPGAAMDDPGLLSAAETSLLIDQYELTMAASYLARGMNEPAAFELFVRHLPPQRDWLLTAGTGPALALVEAMRFGRDDLDYLRSLGFAPSFLQYLSTFRFSGRIDAMPEGTVAFASEPLVRVIAPRVEAQLLETLLLNQVNFQTAIATKAARLVLAAAHRGRAGASLTSRRGATTASMPP